MILIFEGPERVGKTSLINYLRKEFSKGLNFSVSFGGLPKYFEENPKLEKEYFFDLSMSYLDLIKTTITRNKKFQKIKTFNWYFDRFIYGEYVYGSIYRKQNKLEIKRRILDFERKLFNNKFIKNSNTKIVLIILYSSDTKLLLQREDNLSLFNEKLKKEKLENEESLKLNYIYQENEAFKEVYDFSRCKNKLLIDVSKPFKNENTQYTQSVNFDLLKYIKKFYNIEE